LSLYEAEVDPPAWDNNVAAQVRQTLRRHGVQDQLALPAVAEAARECYEYNPALLPYFATAVTSVGPEHANLGTAILIKDLKDRYTWDDRQINYANLAAAEHLRVRGLNPTLDTVRNTDLNGLAASGAVNEPLIFDPNHSTVAPRTIDSWT